MELTNLAYKNGIGYTDTFEENQCTIVKDKSTLYCIDFRIGVYQIMYDNGNLYMFVERQDFDKYFQLLKRAIDYYTQTYLLTIKN